MSNPTILGGIVERPSSGRNISAQDPSVFVPSPNTSTGFPVPLHRSLRPTSAFKRSRTAGAVPPERPAAPPVVASTEVFPEDALLAGIHEENEARVRAMSAEEVQQETEELRARFGDGLLDMLRKRAEKRKAEEKTARPPALPAEEVADMPQLELGPGEVAPPPPAPSAEMPDDDLPPLEPGSGATSASQPGPSRRTVRFSVPSPPPSLPARPAPAPKSQSIFALQAAGEAIETPDTIRSRFFPTATYDPAKLEWLQPLPEPAPEPSTSANATRFDFRGAPLSAGAEVPAHLGLHHHGDDPHAAGYTLPELLHLAQSTVAPQRALALGVLGRIVRRRAEGAYDERVVEKLDKDGGAAKAVMALRWAVEERNLGVLAAGLEGLYGLLVSSRSDEVDIEGVELGSAKLPVYSGPITLSPDELSTLSAFPLPFLVFRTELPYRLAALLSPSSSPLSSDAAGPRAQILALLRRIAAFSRRTAKELAETDGLVPAVHQAFIARRWPPTELAAASDPTAIAFLRSLAAADRKSAQDLIASGSVDILLRFLAVPPWAVGADAPDALRATAWSLATETLRLLETLARYGLYTQAANTGWAMFSSLGKHLSSLSTWSAPERAFGQAFFALLGTWTTCAVDPHNTTPEHEIVWSQIEAWHEIALGVLPAMGAEGEEAKDGLRAAVWGYFAAWAEGCRINAPRGGESERALLQEALRPGREGMEEVSQRAAKRIVELAAAPAPLPLDSVKTIGRASALLLSAVRLTTSLSADPSTAPVSAAVVHAANALLPVLSTPSPSDRPWQYAFLRPASALLGALASTADLSTPDGLRLALDALVVLQRGDEALAQKIAKRVLGLEPERLATAASLNGPAVSVEGASGVSAAIEHFILHAILPPSDTSCGPYVPLPSSLPSTTTLLLPPTSAHSDKPLGLPLLPSWPLSAPLGELLHSGSSTAFKTLPPDWDATELELVRASLVLARAVWSNTSPAQLPSSADVLFQLMRVFMLEHGLGDVPTDEGEVFRDDVISSHMSALLDFFVSRSSPQTLEQAAAPYLPSGTPFYQFYTDFAGLFDAISFSHPLFAKLLLLPLASTYPTDYRRLVWTDYPQALRGVRLTPVDVPAPLGPFLWPLDQDRQVLAAYVRALVRSSVRRETNAFVYWLALHHVASSVWDEDGEDSDEKKRKDLAGAVLSAGSKELVRDFARYRQTKGELREMPGCFEKADIEARLAWLRGALGPAAAGKMQAALEGV